MDSPDFPTGKSPRSLQGPRPAPLRVHKDSHKISKKPPVAPPHHHQNQQLQPTEPPPFQHRPPVIIYTVSPKVIHTNPNEFMTLVQRLTGSSGPSTSIPSTIGLSGPEEFAAVVVSPAARFASIERTVKSPEGRKQSTVTSVTNDSDGSQMDYYEGMETGYFPGILSPAPGSLPPIPPNIFSPLTNDFFHDLSPAVHNNTSGNSNRSFGNYMEGNMFIPSPTNLLSSHIISPTTPNFDLFHSLFDL